MQTIVTDQIRAMILAGRLEPGARLNQDELARLLGVSRMPIREALRVLQTEGLIELQPHRSAVVVSLRQEDLTEIYGIRAMLEAEAARRASSRLSEETIVRLRQLYQDMARAVATHNNEQWVQLNRDFHRTIYSACGWPRLQALIETQFNALAPYRRMWDSTFAAPVLAARLARFHKEHGEILQAVEGRDGEEMARRIAAHILETGYELGEFLAGQRAEASGSPLLHGPVAVR
jgi:DNA-binding GntR family transcriptional regulator